jgi:hypothetical protein
MRRSLAAAAACLTLTLAACSPAAKKEANEQQASADVCAQLTRVGTALETAANLKPTSTVGEAEAAGKELRQAIKDLKKSEESLEAARLKDFQTKAKAFNKDLKAVAKDKKLTLEAAAETLKPKAQEVIAAHKALKEGVSCDGDKAAAPAN